MSQSLSRFLIALLFAATISWAYAKETKIRVALFDDAGAAGKGVPRVIDLLSKTRDVQVTKVKGTNIATGVLTNFDVVIFTGGSGSKQAASLGEAGREEVRQFVRNGGGYVGICAGAYLACSGFNWGIGVLNAKTVSPKWERGKGTVEMEVVPESGLLASSSPSKQKVLYANGPIIQPDIRDDLPPYEPVAFFRSELAKNGSPEGVMINSPAIARGAYGKGRVLICSPHPEQTEGLDDFVETFVRSVAKNKEEL